MKRKYIAVVAVVAALVYAWSLVSLATAGGHEGSDFPRAGLSSVRSAQHSLGGQFQWACGNGSVLVVCTVNVYQYTGSYVANIYNATAKQGLFTAPYSYTVDIYAHRNGATQHKSCPASGCFAGFTFSN